MRKRQLNPPAALFALLTTLLVITCRRPAPTPVDTGIDSLQATIARQGAELRAAADRQGRDAARVAFRDSLLTLAYNELAARDSAAFENEKKRTNENLSRIAHYTAADLRRAFAE
ncbi:MAG: hypothetical protein EOO11_19430 [Chitinophagaceae bacterium]|nr:MAG: hypothetical protein EOO11_19430 [Chitinophagaceae bacterium]